MTAHTAREVIAGRRFGSFLAAGLVAVVYVVWAAAIAFDGSPARLALIGERFLKQGAGTSVAVDRLEGDVVDEWGYDGQFALFIALAPIDSGTYLDNPAYRLGRPLYPLAAAALAVGDDDATPYTLVLVNLAAVVGLTFALARVLERYAVSAWYALLAGLSPGLAIAVGRDLVEPVAYALTAVAVLVLVGRGDRWRVVPAGIVFALAALTRETTLLFPLAAAAALVIGAVPEPEREAPVCERARRALTLFVIASAPVVLLKLILVASQPGDGLPSAVRTEPIPFLGVLWDGSLSAGDRYQLRYLALPALLGLLTVVALVRRPVAPVLALALNVLVLVVLLPRRSYEDYLTSSRIMLGVTVAFVLCVPELPARWRPALVALPVVLWLAPWRDVHRFMVGL